MLFVKIRNAIFTESGFNLSADEIFPYGLKSSAHAIFMRLDSKGKGVGLEPIPGCSGTGDAIASVPLHPYRGDADGEFTGRELVALMSEKLTDALAGDVESKESFARAVEHLIFGPLALLTLDGADQLKALAALAGGRAHSLLIRNASVTGLKWPKGAEWFDDAFRCAAAS